MGALSTLTTTVIAIYCGFAHAQSSQPYAGGDVIGNLHINSTATTKVFVDGVDILDELAELRRQVEVLLLTAAPTTTEPTSSEPTAAPTTVAPTTVAPSGSPTSSPTTFVSTLLVCEGTVRITSDADLRSQTAALRRCGNISGAVLIQGGGVTSSTLLFSAFEHTRHISGNLIIGSTGLITFGAAFPALRTIYPGVVSFGSNNQMTSMGTAFASLLTIGAVAIGDSCRLATFGNAFANVRTIDRYFQELSNPSLTSFGTAFRNLNTINGEMRFAETSRGGCTGSFPTPAAAFRGICSSAGPVLCVAGGLGNAYFSGTNSARTCCDTFCSTSTAC